jgi:outer membrane protein OmpA-like peptidoglycan-associated protein
LRAFLACLLAGLLMCGPVFATTWHYTVYFDAGSDEISDQGRSTLKELEDTVAAVPRACPITIIVEGYVDGREALDTPELDHKRIDAAVSYLRRRDLSNITFRTHAHGFSKPFVPTAAGVSSALNRVVRAHWTLDSGRASRRDVCSRW